MHRFCKFILSLPLIHHVRLYSPWIMYSYKAISKQKKYSYIKVFQVLHFSTLSTCITLNFEKLETYSLSYNSLVFLDAPVSSFWNFGITVHITWYKYFITY